MHPFDAGYWMTNIVGFAGALLLCQLIAFRARTWLTHAHLFSLMWGANLFVSQVALDGLLRPDLAPLLVLFAAWWLFLAGSLLIMRRPLPSGRPPVHLHRHRAVLLLLILLAMQGFAFLVELRAVGHTPLSFLRDFVTASLRLRIDEALPAQFFFSWSLWRWNQFLYVPLALLLHSKALISGRTLTLVYLWAILLASAKFTRMPLIGVAVISFVGWLVLYKPTARARLLVGATLAFVGLALFVVTQTALVERHTWWKVTPGESLVAYIGSSPLAYDTLLKGYYPREEGVIYSLEPVNYLLSKLSLIRLYPGLRRPFADMPFVTNVYTFLDGFTLDGGIPGALAGALVMGGFAGLAYNRLSRRVTYSTLAIYCYLSFCCVMAIATNEFIRVAVVTNILLAEAVNWAIVRRTASTRVA